MAKNASRPPSDELATLRPRPDPKLVALVSWAIAAVARKVYASEYAPWLHWAGTWEKGKRNPCACVDMGEWCFSHRDPGKDGGVGPAYHALGQIAWAAKEACYTTPQSGWLVVRYIGDARRAYGIGFPADGLALPSPSVAPPSHVGPA